MGVVLDLESFDKRGPGSQASDIPPATYEDGYEAGHAAALAELSETQDQLRESLVQSLNDSAFGYQEAQSHFMSGMTIYLEAVLDKILPETLSPALHGKLRAILIDGMEQDAKRRVTLQVPFDQVEPIERIISEFGMSHVTLSGNSGLTDHAAFVVSCDSETSLDLDAALAAIRDHSEILLQSSQEVS
jgi:hypothetical protein